MFLNFLISPAFSQATASTNSNPSSSLTNFVPLILIFIVFYFLLIRPQQKKIKEHQETLSKIKSGDKIWTNSGIFATIKSINEKDNIVELEIANNVIIKILKQNIATVIGENNHEKSVIKKSKKNK